MDIFDVWSQQKKIIHKSQDIRYFHPREIWFIRMGKNIGSEQNGKGQDFLRPVLVLKKFNKHVFWGIALSTKVQKGKYYFPLKNSGGKTACAILSQIRLIDQKRLHNKVGYVGGSIFMKIKKAISAILLANDDF